MPRKRKGPRIPTLSERIDDAYFAEPQSQRCLICGGPAREFGFETFPRIRDYIANRIDHAQLEQLVRATFKDKRSCFFAPKSYVCVCSDQVKTVAYLTGQRRGAL